MRSEKIWPKAAAAWSGLLCLALALSCGGVGGSRNPGSGPATGSAADQICNCVPSEPDSVDYRHNAKHVPLPDGPAQEIDVNTILSWSQGPIPGFAAARQGRETQLFHIAKAYLQQADVQPDCDIHFEISATPDPKAPRVIVETPVDGQFCTSRQTVAQQLQDHGFFVSSTSGALSTPLAVTVTGLAFIDFPHDRGSKYVATVWELHPAIVTLLE